MDVLKQILLAVLLMGLSFGAGYYYAPDKIKIEEKIVEKVIHEKDTKVTKEYDPKTGKVTKETTETKDKQTNVESKDKTTEKTKTQKLYAIKAGGAINPRDLSSKLTPRVGVEIRLPVFSSWIGIEGDLSISKPLVGAYLRLEF